MEEQRKLIFYPQWYNVIKVQPDNLRLALYDAILQYKYEGKEPSDPIVLMAFGFIKQQIDADNQKYDEVCERNRFNGAKGGRPKKTQNNPENPNGFSKTQNNPENPNEPNNNNNCNCNNNDNNSTIINNCSCNSDKLHVPNDIVSVVEYWNESIIKHKANIKAISNVRTGSQRHTWIRARLNENGMQAVMQAIDNAMASKFLNCSTKEGFFANADWVFRPNNFDKVLAGNYNEPQEPTGLVTEVKTPIVKQSDERTNVQKMQDNDKAYDDWCRANGKDPDNKESGKEYFLYNQKLKRI